MTFDIFMEFDHGVDSIRLIAETIEEIQQQASQEIAKRKPIDYWSEEVKP